MASGRIRYRRQVKWHYYVPIFYGVDENGLTLCVANDAISLKIRLRPDGTQKYLLAGCLFYKFPEKMQTSAGPWSVITFVP